MGPATQYVKSWVMCSSSLQYTESAENLPVTVYPTLIQSLRVLIYNGDVDCCVPFTDNESWTASLGLPVSAPWHPWTIDNQVAGYATVYSVPNATHPFTFITVKVCVCSRGCCERLYRVGDPHALHQRDVRVCVFASMFVRTRACVYKCVHVFFCMFVYVVCVRARECVFVHACCRALATWCLSTSLRLHWKCSVAF